MEIDFSIIPENLTLESFVLLNLIYNKEFEIIDSLIEKYHTSSLLMLELREYIKITNKDPKSWILRQKTLNLFPEAISNSSEAEQIFQHFKDTYDKYSGKKSKLKYETIKEYLIKRCKNGLTLQGAKQIIELKFTTWWNTDMTRHLNIQTLLGPKHYDNYLSQTEMIDLTQKEVDFSNDI